MNKNKLSILLRTSSMPNIKNKRINFNEFKTKITQEFYEYYNNNSTNKTNKIK